MDGSSYKRDNVKAGVGPDHKKATRFVKHAAARECPKLALKARGEMQPADIVGKRCGKDEVFGDFYGLSLDLAGEKAVVSVLEQLPPYRQGEDYV
jgi:hypothetical protein